MLLPFCWVGRDRTLYNPLQLRALALMTNTVTRDDIYRGTFCWLAFLLHSLLLIEYICLLEIAWNLF